MVNFCDNSLHLCTQIETVTFKAANMIINFKGSAKFKDEIEEWVRENIITGEQAKQLFTKYDLEKEPPWYLRTSFIISGLALLLVAMGFFLIISENWNQFGTVTRMLFGVVPLLAAYGFGVFFAIRQQKDNAELALFFGSLMFGLNIFLQAQIFHISSYYPNGVLWWLIGSVPLALYFRSNLHNFLLQIIFFTWVNMLSEHHNFSLMIPILFAAILYLLYLKPNFYQLLFSIVNLYVLLYNGYFALPFNVSGNFVLFASISLLVLAGLQFLAFAYKGKEIMRLNILLNLIIVFMLYLTTFEEITRGIAHKTFPYFAFSIAALSTILYFLKHKQQATSIWSFAITAVLFLIYSIGETVQEITVIVLIINNLVFFSYAVWQIYYGMETVRKQNFMYGVSLILLLAISRYFDLFDNYLLSALVFMFAGLLIFFLNRFWNKKYSKQKQVES